MTRTRAGRTRPHLRARPHAHGAASRTSPCLCPAVSARPHLEPAGRPEKTVLRL